MIEYIKKTKSNFNFWQGYIWNADCFAHYNTLLYSSGALISSRSKRKEKIIHYYCKSNSGLGGRRNKINFSGTKRKKPLDSVLTLEIVSSSSSSACDHWVSKYL